MSRQVILSKLAVEAGLWYVISLRYDNEISSEMQKMSADMVDYWAGKLKIPPQMKTDLAAVLEDEAAAVDAQRAQDIQVGAEKTQYQVLSLDEVWPRIVLAQRRAHEVKGTTIPAAVYERLRSQDITARGVQSSQGMVRWPPTCQTVTKRCGGSWNSALHCMGLTTSKRGRGRGPLKFTPETYLRAATEFLQHCQTVGKANTVAYYCQWVMRERREGRTWPSAAAQRQLKGTWNNVMDQAHSALARKALSN